MQQKYLRMEMRRSRRGYPWRRPRPEARGARDALIPSGRIKGSFAPRFTADSPWECAPNKQPPGFADRQLSRNGGSGSAAASEFKMQDPMRIDRSDRVERRRDRRGGNLTTEAGGSEVQGRGEERREKLLGLLDRELVWPFRAERIER